MNKIANEILQQPINELIYINKLYQSKFAATMSEYAFFKTVERLSAANLITKMSKGVYCRPKITKYGTVLPSDREIIKLYTDNNGGTVVGYSLYNALNLTTQIAKKYEVYSSSIEQQTKTIGNVVIKQHVLEYTDNVINTIHIMDVLHHYDKIQDLNIQQFVNLCEKFKKQFNEEVFEYVIRNIRYPKRTVAFLKNILDYFHVGNSLNSYLSAFSTYDFPRMEKIYEAAQTH